MSLPLWRIKCGLTTSELAQCKCIIYIVLTQVLLSLYIHYIIVLITCIRDVWLKIFLLPWNIICMEHNWRLWYMSFILTTVTFECSFLNSWRWPLGLLTILPFSAQLSTCPNSMPVHGTAGSHPSSIIPIWLTGPFGILNSECGLKIWCMSRIDKWN